MSQIVRFHELGGPEVLKIEDSPSMQPSKDEVALTVRAIGLNRAESMFMHGYYLELTRLPARLGLEASGTVTAIVPVHALAEYPAHLTPIEATSIWMQYLTAYGALVEFGRMKKGDFVLITAGSSSAASQPSRM